MSDRKVCAVVGVGPGVGAAYARRFAQGGYDVALLARSTDYTSKLAAEIGGGARAFACDASDPASIDAAFAAISAEMGAPSALLYNAGGGTRGSVEEVAPDVFETAWRVNALGLFTAARAVAPGMKAAEGGAIIITGATASRRGGPATAAFAPAKAAQRSLAESMAKSLWPAQIHVALIIVDGVVASDRTRAMFPNEPETFFLAPEDVAESAWSLANQPRSAWSFEVEARPFAEKW